MKNIILKGVRFCTTKATTQNLNDTRKFNQVLDWWKIDGSMKILYHYNYLRIQFMHETMQRQQVQNSLLNLNILDAGCGGGMLSESLRRLGANVIGIDISEMSIKAAQEHKQQDPELKDDDNLKYFLTTPEQIQYQEHFDIVTSMEVIEHIKEKDIFIDSICSKVKKDGYLFMSTINKTWESYLKVIVGAEYITRIVPLQTHDWNLFITPEELSSRIKRHNMEIIKIQGAEYNLLCGKMEFSSNKTNYMLAAKKK